MTIRAYLSRSAGLRQNRIYEPTNFACQPCCFRVGFNATKAQSANRDRGPVFRHDLPDLSLHDWSVTAVEVDYAPGESSKAHRHPGLTFAYVLEGEIASKLDDQPEKTYKTGEMWMETPGQLHAVSRNASSVKPAKLLAILLAERGKPLTTPA